MRLLKKIVETAQGRPAVDTAGLLALLSAAALLLVGAPLLGAGLSGRPLAPYLEFPPPAATGTPPPFSWAVFALILTIVVAGVAPIAWRALRSGAAPGRAPRPDRRLPWWGWLGAVLLAVSWLLAWTRFSWFEPLQKHTFTPLWLGYILTVNAFVARRSGTCRMLAAPGRFLALFPLSALFWWFFEYLNRFVHNWRYVGVDEFSAAAYAGFATISFATVLPAVLSTRDALATLPWLEPRFRRLWAVRVRPGRGAAAVVLTATVLSLAGVGAWPQGLFPLVWISPLLIILCLQRLAGRETVLAPLARGDWRCVCLPALAALVCGFLWELWNFRSLAHWEYAIAYVDRFHLFEMPILGYAGYLPFGLECAVAASLIRGRRG